MFGTKKRRSRLLRAVHFLTSFVNYTPSVGVGLVLLDSILATNPSVATRRTGPSIRASGGQKNRVKY